jgi:nitrite reductase/ring-hydroxylating ferredoxin subunit
MHNFIFPIFAVYLPAGDLCALAGSPGQVAVYCDANGQKKAYSAVCPHLGCIVHVSTAWAWDAQPLPLVAAVAVEP